ncbi:MAG: hypothetical protein R3344_11500, partial [Acidobacteriota bacterium]|nr:hypothetical protein [Acidobacteriota bacterium]
LGDWVDAESDRAWVAPDAAEILRRMDRFHPIPDVPRRAGSWAEWLYFNGSAGNTRFYLSFLVGPRTTAGMRRAGVRLQLEDDGRMRTFRSSAEIDERELLARAPDVRIGRSEVRLEGLRYRATLDLDGRGGESVVGEITLEAPPGRSIPPVTVRGAGGWVSGYVVPVLSGEIGGALRLGSETISLAGGSGYHDHNWGFWEGVTWHWGQVAHDELSFVWGRILPPADAADRERAPGFLGAMGPDGPLGFSTSVTIAEEYVPGTRHPRSMRVRGRSGSVALEMLLDIESVVESPTGGPSPTNGEQLDFLQMRALYRVAGRIGSRSVDFVAPGAAETFVRRAVGPQD